MLIRSSSCDQSYEFNLIFSYLNSPYSWNLRLVNQMNPWKSYLLPQHLAITTLATTTMKKKCQSNIRETLDGKFQSNCMHFVHLWLTSVLNINSDTPTSSGPNSFGKTKQGFCDVKKIFEKSLREFSDD